MAESLASSTTRREPRSRRGDRAMVALAAVTGVVFLIGVGVMFQWRFRAGDVYPPGSSLRSDPKGTRAFYESLQQLPGIEVQRNFEPVRLLRDGEGKTLLFLGARGGVLHQRATREQLDAFEDFIRQGARVVIAFQGAGLSGAQDKEKDKDEDEDEDEKEDEKEDEDEDEKEDEDKDEDDEDLFSDFAERWGIEGGSPLAGDGKAGTSEGDRSDRDMPEGGWRAKKTRNLEGLRNADLPAWWSEEHFKFSDARWEVLARVNKRPVLARLRLGEGAVIAATDSVFATNEALAFNRAPEFLAWLAGGNPVVIFEETHHGTVRQLGVMQLARKYGLHGFFIGLTLFVVLLAWRCGSSLLPGDEEMLMRITVGHQILGEDAASASRKLLLRSVRARDLVKTCFDTWKDQSGRLPCPCAPERVTAAGQVVNEESAMPRRQFDPVAAYRRVAEILGRRD